MSDLNQAKQLIIKKLQNLTFKKIEKRAGHLLSAVLVIFVNINNQLHIVFTRRTNKVKNHKGQVSFPGGVMEIEDRDLIDTALRETLEEIGLSYSREEVICQLPEVFSLNNYQIIPFVVFSNTLENLVINKREVIKIFSIPFDWLSNPCNWAYEDYPVAEGIRKVVVFREYEGEKLWGLTAQIVVNLIDLIHN